MKKYILIIIYFISWVNNIKSQEIKSPQIKIYSFDQLEPMLHKNNDTLYLIHFWATWCIPCREEMPVFVQLEDTFQKDKFRIIFISLDMRNTLEKQVLPYITKLNIRSEVILLDDTHQNIWIDKVDKNWGGDIPYSLLYYKNYRRTFTKAININFMDSIIRSDLNKFSLFK